MDGVQLTEVSLIEAGAGILDAPAPSGEAFPRRSTVDAAAMLKKQRQFTIRVRSVPYTQGMDDDRYLARAAALRDWLATMGYSPMGSFAGTAPPTDEDLLPLFRGAAMGLWPWIISSVVPQEEMDDLHLNVRLQRQRDEDPEAAARRSVALVTARERRRALIETLISLEERTTSKQREAATLEKELERMARIAAARRSKNDDLRARIAMMRAFEAKAQRRRDATRRHAREVGALRRVLKPRRRDGVDAAAWCDAALAASLTRVSAANAEVAAPPLDASNAVSAATSLSNSPSARELMRALCGATEGAARALKQRTLSIDIASEVARLAASEGALASAGAGHVHGGASTVDEALRRLRRTQVR